MACLHPSISQIENSKAILGHHAGFWAPTWKGELSNTVNVETALWGRVANKASTPSLSVNFSFRLFNCLSVYLCTYLCVCLFVCLFANRYVSMYIFMSICLYVCYFWLSDFLSPSVCKVRMFMYVITEGCILMCLCVRVCMCVRVCVFM